MPATTRHHRERSSLDTGYSRFYCCRVLFVCMCVVCACRLLLRLSALLFRTDFFPSPCKRPSSSSFPSPLPSPPPTRSTPFRTSSVASIHARSLFLAFPFLCCPLAPFCSCFAPCKRQQASNVVPDGGSERGEDEVRISFASRSGHTCPYHRRRRHGDFANETPSRGQSSVSESKGLNEKLLTSSCGQRLPFPPSVMLLLLPLTLRATFSPFVFHVLSCPVLLARFSGHLVSSYSQDGATAPTRILAHRYRLKRRLRQ